MAAAEALPRQGVSVAENPLREGIAVGTGPIAVDVAPGIGRRRVCKTCGQPDCNFSLEQGDAPTRAVAHALFGRQQIAVQVSPALASGV